MSELINTQNGERGFRWQLLTTVSAIALLASVNIHDAKAADEDTDRPTVWIELGGQAEDIAGQGEAFAPAFLAANPNSSVVWKGTSATEAQKLPLFNFGEEAKVSFQPESTDWVFSAAVRYGRSGSSNKPDHQTNGIFHVTYKSGVPKYPSKGLRGIDNFSDTEARHSESRSVLDFQAGKDVGLGMFGRDGSSTLSLGVRFAQFTSQSTFDVRARPNLQFKYQTFAADGLPSVSLKLPHFHTYHATGQAARSFHGVGPSLSWAASAPFVGNVQDGEVTLDWGANIALLFGRQKTKTQHHESGHYKSPGCIEGATICRYGTPTYQHSGGHPFTDRFVTVPNVGGMAGASFRIENVKVSVGYRADFFFGAIDGGIDTRKSETLGFYGPFASVSVGFP